MEIPILTDPQIISGLTDMYREAFSEVRSFKHFKELVSELQVSNKRSIAYLNSLSIDHTNQSNKNRFLSSKIDEDMIFKTNIKLINSIEKNGTLIIDDTIIEKTGKNIEAAGWIFDHTKGKNVWGIQIVTSVFSGTHGIYPIYADIYMRLENTIPEEYKTKIEMQKNVIEKCIESGLHFSTVVGDIWYFSKDLIEFLKSKNIGWIFQSKGNRKIKVEGRWTTLNDLNLSYQDSETIEYSGNLYSVWEIVVKMKGIGMVKVVITEGTNGRRYYVTNRIDWKARKIMETYIKRWDIEVMHRDLKQDGLGGIYLRKLCKTKLYLHLIVTGRLLLEISSIRSLCKYQSSDRSKNKTIEKRKRWISFEFIEQLFKGFKKYVEIFVDILRRSIMNPYKSTRGILANSIVLYPTFQI